MSDLYDEAVAYFESHLSEIYVSWKSPTRCKFGYLFKFASSDGTRRVNSQPYCGCPSEIRMAAATLPPNKNDLVAETPELTTQLRNLVEVPQFFACMLDEERPKHLAAFAKAQRLIDATLGIRVVFRHDNWRMEKINGQSDCGPDVEHPGASDQCQAASS